MSDEGNAKLHTWTLANGANVRVFRADRLDALVWNVARETLKSYQIGNVTFDVKLLGPALPRWFEISAIFRGGDRGAWSRWRVDVFEQLIHLHPQRDAIRDDDCVSVVVCEERQVIGE